MSRFFIQEKKSEMQFLDIERHQAVRIKAQCIGRSLLQEIQKENQTGEVISVFDRAVNIRLASGFMLSILSVEYGFVPFGISVKTFEIQPFVFLVKVDDQVCINEDSLLIGTLNVDLRQAKIGKPINSIYVQADHLVKTYTSRASVIKIISEHGICQYRYPLLTLLGEFEGKEVEDEITVLIHQKVQLLESAFLHEDILQSSRVIKSMIGIGYGTTPSADDLLLGFMAFFTLLKSDVFSHSFLDEVWCNALAEIAGKTTTISELYLTYGLNGQFTEILSDYIFQLVGGNPVLLRKATLKLLGIGATSGLDMLVGVLLAVGLIEKKMKKIK